jgi:hypothetical protein
MLLFEGTAEGVKKFSLKEGFTCLAIVSSDIWPKSRMAVLQRHHFIETICPQM